MSFEQLAYRRVSTTELPRLVDLVLDKRTDRARSEMAELSPEQTHRASIAVPGQKSAAQHTPLLSAVRRFLHRGDSHSRNRSGS
ncbi:MAG: hypothetical protein HY692_07305 [Cyanobacteria bacterium NC_groundwater_1444_Ag_S-0.65um_54_12]|nr:hypothetical protein [Cyanobacteria bacterium NC_groundwater_1444_Ag_S-0.65um_54_12]